MTGLDCNILVQLALADHPSNSSTITAVQAEAQATGSLVFPPLVVTEFLHVVTDDRRFVPPLTMIEALDWIEDFLTNPPRKACIRPCAECGNSTWVESVSSTRIWPPSSTPPVPGACSHRIRATSRCLAFFKPSRHRVGSPANYL